MYLARSCPCCGSPEFVAYRALTSAFLASYVLDRAPEPTRLLECEGCAFRFFETRLTDAESGVLYSGYRGERYFRERHRHEPWYTRKVNEAIGGDDAVVSARRAMIERVLRGNLDVRRLRRVLDFGGDRGQVLPVGIGNERFVYEISGTHPVQGVSNIGTAAELRAQTFDLVLLCHVLEHCSEPAAVLDEVRPLLASKESVLYIELPYERPTLRFIPRHGAYATWLSLLPRVPPLLMALDLYSTAFRVRWNVMPPLGFVKMHEHLNFFDVRSLRALLERTGFATLHDEVVEIVSPLGPASVLVALARPR